MCPAGVQLPMLSATPWLWACLPVALTSLITFTELGPFVKYLKMCLHFSFLEKLLCEYG